MLRPWQISLSQRIDAARSEPVYMQIIQAVIRDIESGRLTSGSYLPSSRELAAGLGVNRKTVVLAYEDLIAQGWLSSAGTRGTMVSTALPDPAGTVAPEGSEASGQAEYRFIPGPEHRWRCRRGGASSSTRGHRTGGCSRWNCCPAPIAAPPSGSRGPTACSTAIRAAPRPCVRVWRQCSRASAACR
ncbi:GntR family transcriptional regulator [Novosphingobium resinovorum]